MSAEDYEPLTYVRIEAGIREAINRLADLNKKYAEAADDLAEKEVLYKRHVAEAFIICAERLKEAGERPTEKRVSIQVDLETSDDFRSYRRAEAMFKSIGKALEVTRSRLDAMRSLLVNARVLEGHVGG